MNAPARLRMSRTALLPVLILVFCVVPLALASAWTLVLLLIPVAVAAWVLRVGVDIGDDGITARSLAGSRTVSWTELAGIRIDERNALWLVTTAGTEVRLPVVRTRDLPRLAALSGGRVDVPAPPAQ
ncbi:PH domain-containing protein [Blastococcus sp. PRF04-17]|uniref:PH domain-containing protein n=1 Tax=Blastococcus sp. PRF04-17 TaxID=2933797 RepID=UPI001FF25BF9|nr:PH domain-containing protein [Blastococcus sp. PRF04-17]UOY01459.1 PH domain-containing protein [Blastococcus sp. PRF04-17]